MSDTKFVCLIAVVVLWGVATQMSIASWAKIIIEILKSNRDHQP
jgi:hypothetical protein